AGRHDVLTRLDRCGRTRLREPLPVADDAGRDVELATEFRHRLLARQDPLDRGPLELGAKHPSPVGFPSVLAHGSSRRILRPHGEQSKRGALQAELTALEPEIEALKTKAGKAEAEATKLINELKAHRKLLKEKLSELRHASGGAWEDVKTGATRAWDELRPALQSAISKFR